MIKNYLKIAFRHLLKNKTHSLINVFGISIAFVCCILLFINAINELSFDSFHNDKNRLFKLYSHSQNSEGEQLSRNMGYPVAPTLKNESAEIEYATRLMNGGGGIEYKGKQFDIGLDLVDPDFLKLFTFPIKKGNMHSPLNSTGNIVLTESAAKIVFNTEDPIGKTIKANVRGQWMDLQVSAIANDSPLNSSIRFEGLCRIELGSEYNSQKDNWNNQHHEVYVKLKANTIQSQVEKKLTEIQQKYNPIDTNYVKNLGYLPDASGSYFSFKLMPLEDNHFNTDIGTGQIISKSYLYSIILIGVFILFIACFNFINLNIAQSYTRSKEVGIRKCIGAHKNQIFIQVWGESLLICIISLVIGIALSLICIPYFNKLFNSQLTLSYFYKPSSLLMILSVVTLVSLIAGGYPAYIISKLNTISVLKGSSTFKKSGLFRNSLIVIQFSVACLLMACTLIAYKQFQHMKNMPLGFNKESVISIPLQNGNEGRSLLKKCRNHFALNPNILSITGSNINIGLGKDGSISKSTSGFGYKDKSISTNWINADYDFLKTLGIKLISGRDFSKDYGTDETSGVLVTESMAKQFGVKDAVGITFSTDTASPNWKIIGVIPDFHLYSLHEKVEPLTIDINPNRGLYYLFIKIQSKNLSETMKLVENYYKELEPGKEFRGTFMDENTNNWYKKEERLSVLLLISTTIAITLSCLGLFALAMLMIQQRIKEIGVRKVLGASVASINKLLTKDFIKLVIIAILIASPLAWWLMNSWLQDFPYRTDINWYLFLLIGGLALLVSILTISFHTIKAAIANPIKSLRTE